MAYELCEKVRELEPYEPISGTYRIRLDANESFYNMPEEVKKEIKEMIDEINFNRYPDPRAWDLVCAFADYYGIDPKNVTATNGSDEVLYLLASAMLQRGSRVLVTEPDFSMYHFYSFLSENQVIEYQKKDHFKIDIDEFITCAKKNKIDMIIFSNPCNPTGQGMTREEARKLVESVDCLVVLDEAYMDFWDQGLLQEVENYDNLIILKTASKAVGSAAVRLGFAIANDNITKALQAVKSPYNVNTLSQKIGECIFRKKELLKSRCETIIQNTKNLYNNLIQIKENYHINNMNIDSPCTNFLFIQVDFAEELFEYLLQNGIAIRYFKKYHSLRITTGTEEENKELLIYIERFLLEKVIKVIK